MNLNIYQIIGELFVAKCVAETTAKELDKQLSEAKAKCEKCELNPDTPDN